MHRNDSNNTQNIYYQTITSPCESLRQTPSSQVFCPIANYRVARIIYALNIPVPRRLSHIAHTHTKTSTPHKPDALEARKAAREPTDNTSSRVFVVVIVVVVQ